MLIITMAVGDLIPRLPMEMCFAACPDSVVRTSKLQQAFERVLQGNLTTGLPTESIGKAIDRYLAHLTLVRDKAGFTRSIPRVQMINRRQPLGYAEIIGATRALNVIAA